MVLSDGDIRKAIQEGRILIDPYDDAAVQPASIDLRLGRQLRVFQSHRVQVIDVRQELPHLTDVVEIDELNPFVLHPSEFALAMTMEEVRLPNDIVGRLDGKSSLGRLGLVVHSTAGFVDPGWQGRLTLELSNLANLPIALYSGMKISQLSFVRLSSPAERPYGSKGLGSKYQGQMEPTASRFFTNYGSAAHRGNSGAKQRRSVADPLRAWIQESEFHGSVKLFAESLEVNLKTVEDWVYGRSMPSRRYWPRLYKLTGLSQFQAQGRELTDLGA